MEDDLHEKNVQTMQFDILVVMLPKLFGQSQHKWTHSFLVLDQKKWYMQNEPIQGFARRGRNISVGYENLMTTPARVKSKNHNVLAKSFVNWRG